MGWRLLYGRVGHGGRTRLNHVLLPIETLLGFLLALLSLNAAPISINFKGNWPGFRGGALADVQVIGNLAYVSLAGGLTILDVSDPYDFKHVGHIELSGGGLGGVPLVIKDQRAYLGGYAGLRVIDVSNPAQPILLKSFDEAPIHRLTTVNDFAYGLSYSGLPQFAPVYLIIFDLDHGTVSTNRTFSAGTSMAVQGDHAYIFDGFDLKMLNLGDPAHPYMDGSITLRQDAGAVMSDTAVQGDYAYVCDGFTFYIVDIRDPGNPSLVSRLRGSIDALPPEQRPCIGVSGTNAYVGGVRLAVIDVSNPATPSVSGRFLAQVNDSLGFYIHHDSMIESVRPVGKRVYMAVDSEGLQVFDVSSPSAAFIEHVFYSHIDVRQIVFSNNRVYALNIPVGLQVLDISAPENPRLLGTFPYQFAPDPGFHGTIEPAFELVGSSAFIFDISNGLSVVDFAIPSEPRLISKSSVTDVQFGPVTNTSSIVWRNYTVAVDDTGIHVADVSSPSNPAALGDFPATGLKGVTLAGSLAVVAHGEQGVSILDLGPQFAAPPGILTQPLNQRVLPGASARFDVGANGAPPLSCQWKFDGTNIPSETNFFLPLSSVKLSDAGSYSAVISNSLGFTDTTDAILSVDIPPLVSFVNPTDFQVVLGPTNITLAADASDPDTNVPVAKVEFLVGTNSLGAVTNAPFTLTWTNTHLGTFLLSAVATDNEGPSSTSAVTVVVTNVKVFQFSRTNYVVNESNGTITVTVRRNAGDPGRVTFATLDGTAFAVQSKVLGSYVGQTNVLDFPAGVLSTNIAIPIINDLVNRSNRQFIVQLSEPSSGWQLAFPSNSYVTIIDDDPLANNFADVVVPPEQARSSLQVTLTPNEAGGKWRFQWETEWRDSGSAASNLVAGTYLLEFMQRSGYSAPGTNAVTIGATAGTTFTNFYYANLANVSAGAIKVQFLPSELADTARWRLVGEADTSWHVGGVVFGGIREGGHLAEFQPVEGYQTPVPRVFQVFANQTMTYGVTYEPVPPVLANGPVALASYQTITNDATEPGTPYRFCGQIISDVGFSSGFAAKPRTVLTAAHAVFDAARLSYVSNAWWLPQRERGEFEPPARQARGWHVFEGYSARRQADLANPNLDPNDSSIESRNLDAAALFFSEPVSGGGQGGYGGYLITTASNDWLRSSSLKMLVGYPVENVPQTNVGRMHQVGPFFSAFDKVTDQIYRNTEIHSYGGNSGGPVCVVSTNSLGRAFFIPAGIYLGGSEETDVRVIDLDVVDLVNLAEASASGGTNSTAGGVAKIQSFGGKALPHPGFLTVSVGPQWAIDKGARWRVSPTNYGEQGELRPYTNYTFETIKLIVRSTNFAIEVLDVPGIFAPPSRPAVVVPGETVLLELIYSTNSQTFSVTPQAGPNGTIVPSEPLSVNGGGTLDFLALPDSGFSVAQWLTNGTAAQTGGNRFALTEIGSDMQVTVTFEPAKSVVAAKGTYYGLFGEASGVSPESCGSFIATVTAQGKLSGRMQVGLKKMSFTGQFNSDGRAELSIAAARNALPLMLELQFETDVHGDRLVGAVNQASWKAGLLAERAAFSRTTPSPFAKRHTMVIPGNAISDSVSLGDGFATLNVDPGGNLMMAGSVADGTAIAQKVALAKEGNWPLYIPLYGGRGVIIGWITLPTSPTNEVHGGLEWIKQSSSARYYPNGFTNANVQVAGSVYSPPTKGKRVMDLTNGNIVLAGADLEAPLTNSFALGSNNRATSTGGNRLNLTITAASGVFSGTVMFPDAKKATAFKGVLLQKENAGRGYFLGTQPGRVSIGP